MQQASIVTNDNPPLFVVLHSLNFWVPLRLPADAVKTPSTFLGLSPLLVWPSAAPVMLFVSQ